MPTLTRRHTIYALLATGAFLYFQLFIFPGTPILAWGDQTIYLLDATRIVRGEVIYRDFFHFTLPGTALVYAGLFRLFGIRMWIPQAMLILIGVTLTLLSIVISRKLMSGVTVFYPALLFLIFAFHSELDATHHWYSSLAIIAALASLLEERSTIRLAGAGALCGVATLFTQSTGLMGILGIALFLAWEGREKTEPRKSLLHKEARLFAGFIAVLLPCSAYFAWKFGLHRIWYCTVEFVAKYYSADRFNTWRVYLAYRPAVHAWRNLPEVAAYLLVHALVPYIYLISFIDYFGRARALPPHSRASLMLVNFTGVFMFLSVALAPSLQRLCAVSLPSFILLVLVLNIRPWPGRALLNFLTGAALCLAIWEPIERQINWQGFLETPTGRTAFLDPLVYEKYRWVLEQTRSNEYFFGDPGVSFALGLSNPAPVDFIRPTDYTRPEQVQALVEALEKDRVRLVMLYPGLDLPQGPGDHLAPFRDYLHAHYHLAKTFPDQDEFWERND